MIRHLFMSLLWMAWSFVLLSQGQNSCIEFLQMPSTDAFSPASVSLAAQRSIAGNYRRSNKKRTISILDLRLVSSIMMATVEDSSSTSNQRQEQSQQISHDKVIFQKVVRPPPGLPDVLFLGYLVDYLEHHFELPSSKLSMVYETQLMDDDDDGDTNVQHSTSTNNRCLLAWDSPLSPSSEATRMEVEVVGIYTGDKKGKKDENLPSPSPSVPSMAMVVVRKANVANGNAATIPPMMQNLFQDSERKILHALDRGLEDFVAGKIKLEAVERQRIAAKQQEQQRQSSIPNFRSAADVIEAEMVEESNLKNTQVSDRVSPEDVVFDAYATEDTEVVEKQNPIDNEDSKKVVKGKAKRPATEKERAKALASMKVSVESHQLTENKPAPTDFAVEAAKRIANRKNKADSSSKNSIPEVASEDFAVAAARKVAKLRGVVKKKVPSSKKKKSHANTKMEPTSNASMQADVSRTSVDSEKEEPSMADWQPQDYFKDMRKFRTVISTPESRAARIAHRDTKAESSGSKNEPASTVPKRRLPNDIKATAKPENSVADIKDTHKLNVRIVDEQNDADPTGEKVPELPKKVWDVYESANQALDEIAQQGQDMTAEEMLRDILKFDEEQKKEETVGTGFASGAFEKAKELLQEKQHQQRSKGQQVGFKELDKDDDNQKDGKRMSAEEELKAMFAAGQQIAEGRITQRIPKEASELLKQSQTTEEDVDRLISRDKSISSHARILDEELAELEISINQSPGEEFDPPRSSPLFDIMSGPETYNPNVELDTVNYPGASLGTKTVKLPKELDEAIKQAQFAASVLEKIRTVEDKNESGETKFRYYSGKSELTTQQVENLQNVVTQASQIGIIDDPVMLMAERSRLQIILHEMWDQPEERLEEIAFSFKDLLLSTNFVKLVRERLRDMADRDLEALRRDDESLKKDHEREREILGKLVEYAQALLKQARALGAELEAQQLEIVRSICKVAMDPSHTTEEETAVALSDAVRDMRPLLDDVFVAYLKYAVAEEEAKLARQGVLDDPDYNQWLFVLKIVQQGVYAEIAKGINRYIEHIWYVLRMETPRQRRLLLENLIDDMPTMDVRPFVQVVENIVGSLGDGVKGDFDGVVPLGEMTNKLLQLHQDVKELLPPERIALKSKDADEWAARQKKRLMEQRKIGEQRLQAAKDNEHREDEIQREFGRSGEVDRFD